MNGRSCLRRWRGVVLSSGRHEEALSEHGERLKRSTNFDRAVNRVGKMLRRAREAPHGNQTCIGVVIAESPGRSADRPTIVSFLRE